MSLKPTFLPTQFNFDSIVSRRYNTLQLHMLDENRTAVFENLNKSAVQKVRQAISTYSKSTGKVFNTKAVEVASGYNLFVIRRPDTSCLKKAT